MSAKKEDEKFEQVVQKIDPQSKLLRTWKLTGGVSAQVTAFEIERPGSQTKKMIVRQHGKVDLKRNPHVAADEFQLLQLLQSAGLAVPRPYYLDQSGEIFSTSYVVVEYIEGKPEFAPANLSDLIFQLATHHWDLCAALWPISQIAGWGLDDITEKTMRDGHRWFITQAFEKLSVH